MTDDEKDHMKHEAALAYVRANGRVRNELESYHVQKGIEAMAAIAFAHIDQMEDDHREALIDDYNLGWAQGYNAGSAG